MLFEREGAQESYFALDRTAGVARAAEFARCVKRVAIFDRFGPIALRQMNFSLCKKCQRRADFTWQSGAGTIGPLQGFGVASGIAERVNNIQIRAFGVVGVGVGADIFLIGGNGVVGFTDTNQRGGLEGKRVAGFVAARVFA